MPGNVINPAAVRAIIADVGIATAERLFGVFRNECEAYGNALQAHLRQQDYQQIAVITHSLKSSSRQFGASDLAALSRIAETACEKESRNQNEIEAAVTAVLAEMETVKAAISELSFDADGD